MGNFKYGVITDSFRCDFVSAVKKAAALGADGVQTYCTNGEISADNLTNDKIVELLDIVKSSGMVFSAICADFGKGFGNRDNNAALIDKSKRVMEIAKNLECNIVTTHISPNKTPFAITIPISVPRVRSIVHNARKPANVVRDDPNTDWNVATIAFAMASCLDIFGLSNFACSYL